MRLVVPCLFALLACTRAEGQPSAPAATGAEGPVVVELFTSQGCSSCPPADRLLGQLAQAGSHAGRAVVPLSFHVDYWNGLGWEDPFSSPAWTRRQHRYADALGDTRVYTPELVVGGAAGMVGSQAAQVTRAIANAARPALLPVTARWSKDKLVVTATAPAGADVVVAIWEDPLGVKVPRGENAGATLAHRHVVRRLERVATSGKAGTIEVAIDPAWRGVGAVAFAQRPDARIVASAVLPR